MTARLSKLADAKSIAEEMYLSILSRRPIAEEIAEAPGEAEAAFTLAAAIAYADDEVDASENDFINQLADWFGIDASRAEEILDQLDQDRDSIVSP